MDTMVAIILFAMMAIGLNMVVGYAGLLDLGYVAFYAIGAYTAAWFASPHFARPDLSGFPTLDFSFGGIGVESGSVASTSRSGRSLSRVFTAFVGVFIGLSDLALRGDYPPSSRWLRSRSSIRPRWMRRRRIPRSDRRRRSFNLINGAFGINPIDPPGFAVAPDHLGLPANFIEQQARTSTSSI